ncbi:MAG: hypothetical protein OES69_11830 [Myxococcales bacterium]|nr:hypothetical protein [Myxococcales bacterium]
MAKIKISGSSTERVYATGCIYDAVEFRWVYEPVIVSGVRDAEVELPKGWYVYTFNLRGGLGKLTIKIKNLTRKKVIRTQEFQSSDSLPGGVVR